MRIEPFTSPSCWRSFYSLTPEQSGALMQKKSFLFTIAVQEHGKSLLCFYQRGTNSSVVLLIIISPCLSSYVQKKLQQQSLFCLCFGFFTALISEEDICMCPSHTVYMAGSFSQQANFSILFRILLVPPHNVIQQFFFSLKAP